MGKTHRQIRPEFWDNGDYRGCHSTKSASKKGPAHYEYMPKRETSKLYQQYGIDYSSMEMNGHHPQADCHRAKSGQLRAKLKQEFYAMKQEELYAEY